MKSGLRAWMGVGIAMTLAGCSAKPGASASPNGDTSNTPGGDTSTPGGDTSIDGGAPSDDGAAPSGSLALASATMQVAGRWGSDIRIDLTGSDPAGATTEATVRLLEADDTPVVAFDTDWDGVADASEVPVVFDTSALGTKTSFTRSITLAGMALRAPTIAKASVALVSTGGAKSAPVSVTLTQQALVKEGEACDATLAANRCAASTACGGTPSTCQAGTAPQIARSAYYTAASSTRMLLGGTDPDQDLSSLFIEFLDSSNQAVKVDLDGDGVAESSTFSLDVSAQQLDAAFVVRNEAAKSFGASVPRIAVTPKDSAGNSGTRKTISLAAPTVRSVGQGCDAQAFDACATGSVCAPGVASATNKCATVSSVRTATCTAAAALDPAIGATKTVGYARGASVWDPPSGCASAEAVGRPEGVARLHLAKAATTLTITTALPETTSDTILYLLPACAAADATPLGCNDDTTGFSSTVTLANVPAGDYAIVVDMAQPDGGRFGVQVSVQ